MATLLFLTMFMQWCDPNVNPICSQTNHKAVAINATRAAAFQQPVRKTQLPAQPSPTNPEKPTKPAPPPSSTKPTPPPAKPK